MAALTDVPMKPMVFGIRSEDNPWVWRYGVEEVTHASTE